MSEVALYMRLQQHRHVVGSQSCKNRHFSVRFTISNCQGIAHDQKVLNRADNNTFL